MNLSFESKVALVTGAAGADADGHALIMLLVCILRIGASSKR